MVAWPLRHTVLLVVGLVGIGQVLAVGAPPISTREGGDAAVSRRDAEVIDEYLAVFDRPAGASFELGQLRHGDRVRLTGRAAGGWAAIEPPSFAIGWVEREALELEEAGGDDGSRAVPERAGTVLPERGRVVVPVAVVRSGRLDSRMPGPPWIELPRGATVRIVDRPPLTIGRGSTATTWLAVVPAEGASCYVRADGLRPQGRREEAAEVRAAYMVSAGQETPPASLPPGVAAEIARVDAMQRGIISGLPVEAWRLDEVRAGYLAILKRWGDQPAVEEALRGRMARITRLEQAASSAREFREILDRSRRRDEEFDRLRRRLAAVDRYRTVTYHAVGQVRPSSHIVKGHKIHALLGRDGRTIAYLDLPPGFDLDAIGTRRVGVRGAVHFNPELGTRLITVREVEPVGTRR